MNTYDSSMAPRLQELLVRSEADLRATLDAVTHRESNGDHDVTDFKDLAAEESRQAVDAVQEEHVVHELAQVLAARRRLDQHGYGTCLECGAAIELERLLALPSTAYCLACQTRHET